MNDQTVSPVDIFQQMERDSLGNQLTDAEAAPGEVWRAFVFNVDGLDLAVPFLGQFGIVPGQDLFAVPMANSWVKGMTNIRGEIYTVVDFSEFIGRKQVRTTKKCNLLLLPDPVLKSALLLDSRISLRSFPHDLPVTGNDLFYAKLAPYLSRVVVDGNKQWGVLDVEALCRSSEFSQIGL